MLDVPHEIYIYIENFSSHCDVDYVFNFNANGTSSIVKLLASLSLLVFHVSMWIIWILYIIILGSLGDNELD